ncbi:hypothetical protein ADL22_08595 [Streptomyces sp. NRRL F-4489]|uniref:DUF4190 domain-containing protein n=1 Tax=Streptomyces sp. NRRL F-4489 TaxID=1609095 RepID=UPI0007468224|nr:DUF4190 domain-containing protein [Streptomyces sp. NRRL F-4489]KUL49199.1 hypothetical protein ADL22_08595 [Streptomyces sp. NRRL F-4489]
MSQQMQYQPVPEGTPGMPAPQAARNGLGVAALVLGIIGLLSGIPMVLFWLAGPLGLLALIFGLVGASRVKKGQATNKGVAITGAVLGGLALILAIVGVVLTALVVNKTVDEINKQVKGSQAQPKDGGESGGKGGETKSYGPGDTAVYPDKGLEVTVAKPSPYTIGEFASGHTAGNKAYKVSVKITNKGKAAFNPALTQIKARTGAEGREAEQIIDGKIGVGFDGTIAPGAAATVDVAFDAPATAKDLDVEVTPDILMQGVHWKLPTS